MRRIRRNIPLLIVSNKGRGYGSRDDSKEVRISIDELWDELDEEQRGKLEKAIDKFIEFHGTEPREIIIKDIPIGEEDEVEFFVGMGKAPAESYDAQDVVGSNKSDAIYVHEYEGQKPMKVMSIDGKMVLTLPGKFRIGDWMRG